MCFINWFLFQLHKIIGFAPGLLQIVMMSEVDMPVRQAGEFSPLSCFLYLIKYIWPQQKGPFKLVPNWMISPLKKKKKKKDLMILSYCLKLTSNYSNIVSLMKKILICLVIKMS